MSSRFFACTLFALSLLIQRSSAVDASLKDAPPGYLPALREAIRAFDARDFPATIKAIDAAEALRPPSPITLNTRGAALIEQKKFEEGAEYCRKALAINPKFYPARFNLCEVPLVQKRYAEAREMFQKLLDENPKDELAQFRILLTWLLEQKDPEARRVLEKIPFPGDTPAYYYGHAAWEFAHENEAEARKWIMRGNWVFRPEVTASFSQPFVEIGWLKNAPTAVSPNLPELTTPTMPAAAKFELNQPEPESSARGREK
jgi:tetratricopeptide (TPR) repeat protein